MRRRRWPSFLVLLAMFVARGAGAEPLAERIATVLNEPGYRQAQWGLLVVDLADGAVLYERSADAMIAPASVTKIFSAATALDAFGAQHRFTTPIFARGELRDGRLVGDLIFVAAGDLTLGGRTDAQGRIAFRNSDHTYAGFSADAALTEPDPLAGLNALAEQVRAAGVERIDGEILIDDRLFQAHEGSGSGPQRLSCVMVNDNVVDILATPTTPGALADVTWRPLTAAVSIDAVVETATEDAPAKIEISAKPGNRLTVRGHVPAGKSPVLRIYEVDDQRAFARTLLIEALRRAGVRVAASPFEQPAVGLPEAGEYRNLKRLAALESPPFSEEIKLILKVSHNPHAGALPMLTATKFGGQTHAEGMQHEREFLQRAGVDVETISFGGGVGGSRGDFVTPRATVQLLRYMAQHRDAAAFREALPILGVDGTTANAVAADSPARGKVRAKTGTLIWNNDLNDRFLLTAKGLAGYAETRSGRTFAFAFFINNANVTGAADAQRVGKDLARLAEIVVESL